MLKHMHMMTKLRPFVRTFLKEASEKYEMHIYTMGDRAYALAMAHLLDPRREYFGDRVISRDDGTQKHQKGLDIVLGQESAVLILDDTENVSFFSLKMLRMQIFCNNFLECIILCCYLLLPSGWVRSFVFQQVLTFVSLDHILFNSF